MQFYYQFLAGLALPDLDAAIFNMAQLHSQNIPEPLARVERQETGHAQLPAHLGNQLPRPLRPRLVGFNLGYV